MQADTEKLLLHALSSGVSPSGPLGALFTPHLDQLHLDEELLTAIRSLHIHEPFLPPSAAVVPMLTASNNWAIHASKSASGFAVQCNDPHLVVSQLPVAIAEVVFHDTTPGELDDVVMGASVPGMPSVIMGRTKFVSFGMT